MKVPFVIYADFESVIEQINERKKNCSTVKIQKHIAISFVYIIVYANGDFERKTFEYFGEDAPKVLYKKLREDAIYIAENYLDNVKKMNELTEIQKKEYENATICHICEEKLTSILTHILSYLKWKTIHLFDYKKENLYKVQDHDHLTGLYRGPAHKYCN
ncbi:unnamed protein product [Macrosiphum euphorbiae]|uniref:Uncharacterized protein n=1 Tax=Macrosiphum euphorbiae TaxID=13131 RepID=A0AAV0W382_9HEMI|nr:unnamed protein product [Macrosiphum euphorbiae]